jgi:hypothetical protein
LQEAMKKARHSVLVWVFRNVTRILQNIKSKYIWSLYITCKKFLSKVAGLTLIF